LRVKNVIFDIGGVVLDWNPDAILAAHYSNPDERTVMRQALFEHPDWLDFDRGVHTEDDLVRRAQQRTGRAEADLRGLFDAIRLSLRPKADTLTLLRGLERRGVPLYCLSNMPASTFTHLRPLHDFWDSFRGIVISGQINLVKPEPAIFQHLLQRFGLVAEQSVFIDDSRPNVEAAATLGLDTVWFRDADQCRAELEPLLGARLLLEQ